MRNRLTVVPLMLVAVAAFAAASLASTPIPPARRVPSEVVRTVAAPADAPMHMPTDVAADSRGVLYVADGARDRVLAFDAKGAPLATYAAFGDERLNRPVGVAVDSRDNLWVADTGAALLRVISPKGRLVQTIRVPEAAPGQPADPTDVLVTSDGSRTYVVDNSNHRLLIRDNRSGKWTALGKYGQALGQFQWPFMIGAGPEGYVFVTEAIGARVQQVSPRDRWAGQIGRWGVELGQFYRPKGVAADAGGRVYVSDSTLGVVQVFGARGAVEGVLTDRDGDQPLRFQHPMGLCFDGAGNLYVTELGANRVAVVALRRAPAVRTEPGGGRAP